MPKIVLDMAEVCDVDEAATLLGKGVATLWRWIKSGKVNVIRISGRTLIPRSEVDRLREKEGTQRLPG